MSRVKVENSGFLISELYLPNCISDSSDPRTICSHHTPKDKHEEHDVKEVKKQPLLKAGCVGIQFVTVRIYYNHVENKTPSLSNPSPSFLLVNVFSRTTSPVQPGDGNNTDTNHQSSTNTCTSLETNTLEHLREPEGADETPDLADKSDEDTDAGSFLLMTVDSIGDQDGSDDLVSDGGNGGTDEGCDVPLLGVIGLNEEDNVADDTEEETRVAKPETVFRQRTVTSRHLASLALHPEIGQNTSELFTNDSTDDDTGKLIANLLSVEVVLFLEELRNLDCDKNGSEQEDHGVRSGRDDDGSVTAHGQGLNKVPGSHGSRVDTSEAPVFLLEIRTTVLNTLAQVTGLGAEEDGKDQLNSVDDGKDVVDPAVADVVGDETHGEAAQGNTNGDHQGPNAHICATLSLEKGLTDNTTSDGSSGTDEESDQSSACGHAGIAMTVGASKVANKTANKRNQPDWATSISDREGSPEQWRSTQDCNLERCKVRGSLNAATQVFVDVEICWNDCCSRERAHHRMERDQQQVDRFL